MSEEKFIPYKPVQIDVRESLYKSELYYQWLDSRRSVREFPQTEFRKKLLSISSDLLPLLLPVPTSSPGLFAQFQILRSNRRFGKPQKRKNMKIIVPE
jgi:hypothetical protein